MKLSFSIVDKKRPIFSKIMICLVIVGWGTTLVLFLEGNKLKETMTTVSLILTISFFLVGELIAKWKKGYSLGGLVNLNAAGIQIITDEEQKYYSFEELSSIEIAINETNCDPNPRGTFNRRKEGINNWIEIKTRNADGFKWMIYVDSANEIEKLDFFLKELNIAHIYVKRNGERVSSIKEAHYRDYPSFYVETKRN